MVSCQCDRVDVRTMNLTLNRRLSVALSVLASNYLLQFDEKYVLNLYLSEFFKS